MKEDVFDLTEETVAAFHREVVALMEKYGLEVVEWLDDCAHDDRYSDSKYGFASVEDIAQAKRWRRSSKWIPVAQILDRKSFHFMQERLA